MPNEIFALHLDGKIITDSNEINGPLPPWQKPRKTARYFYKSRRNAELAVKQLPENIQLRITIVKYVPEDNK